MSQNVTLFIIIITCYIYAPLPCFVIIAERCERSERSEANNHVLFEIPRYLYIYICLSAVHCTRPCTPYASPITSAIVHLEHRLLFGAPF